MPTGTKRPSNILEEAIDAKCQKFDNALDINNIPDDIFYLIFKYIPQVELANTFADICPRWGDILNHAQFWGRLEFDENHKLPEIFKTIIKAGSNLKCLQIANRKDCDYILKKIPRYNINLKNLRMINCRGRPNCEFLNSKIFLHVLKNLLCIEQFYFMNTRFTSTKFFEIIGNEQNLLNRAIRRGGSEIIKLEFFGEFNYKQLEAFTRTSKPHGEVGFLNGRNYNTTEIEEILRHRRYNPYDLVYDLD